MPITIINQLELAVPETATIAKNKELIRIERGFPPEKQTLFHAGEPITENTATLHGLCLSPDSTFVLVFGDSTATSSSSAHVIRSAAQQTCPEAIDIVVFMEGTLEDVASLRVALTDTVYNVKQQLVNELRCDTGRLQLGYGWTVLHDNTMVRDIPTMIECKAVELTLLSAVEKTFATLIDIDDSEGNTIVRLSSVIVEHTETVYKVEEDTNTDNDSDEDQDEDGNSGDDSNRYQEEDFVDENEDTEDYGSGLDRGTGDDDNHEDDTGEKEKDKGEEEGLGMQRGGAGLPQHRVEHYFDDDDGNFPGEWCLQKLTGKEKVIRKSVSKLRDNHVHPVIIRKMKKAYKKEILLDL